MDGIDAALVDVESNRCIDGITRPYSSHTKAFLQAVLESKVNDLKSFSQLNTVIGQEFALAANELMARNSQYSTEILAIGSHGQTLCHDSTADIPYTVQLGCAHVIAEHTGITTVADFRTRDIVAGGQGAPFAPIYHQALFQTAQLPLALVNIGGIANLSYLQDKKTVIGYDIGPGNCLMDSWIEKNKNHSYDTDGLWAASGQVIHSLLDQLMSDVFFQRPSPKSIGKEYFSLPWLAHFLHDGMLAQDIQATLLQLTALTIAAEIRRLAIEPKQVLICGGGAHNQQLIKVLANELHDLPLQSTSALGISADYLEAMMIAWLAEKTMNDIPLDMSTITGAKRKAVLGVIYPAGIDKRNSHAV